MIQVLGGWPTDFQVGIWCFLIFWYRQLEKFDAPQIWRIFLDFFFKSKMGPAEMNNFYSNSAPSKKTNGCFTWKWWFPTPSSVHLLFQGCLRFSDAKPVSHVSFFLGDGKRSTWEIHIFGGCLTPVLAPPTVGVWKGFGSIPGNLQVQKSHFWMRFFVNNNKLFIWS